MKITRFHIENYRGLRDAYAEDLTSAPFIAITGRNGTGKSLVLEALAAVWTGSINLPEFVGPYANSLSLELAVQLSEEEYELVDQWMDEIGDRPIERQDEHVLHAVSLRREHTGHYVERERVFEVLQNPQFVQRYSFAHVDLLSARRQPAFGSDISVDLSLLDSGQNALHMREMMIDEIRWRNGQHMPDAGSYLTALDYREYVAGRDEQQDLGEYARLQEAFKRATGKTITRPSFEPNTGRPHIAVELPSGIRHDLADLSNGEREMIGMFYYISQLASRGGVLLLDEPEKHLHPTLQNAVLEAMGSVTDHGQVIIVTHSPTIVAAIPHAQICSIQGAWETSHNQLRWASESGEDFEPLAEIGLNPRDILQMDAVLIVEGPDDAKKLRMLFPEELARVRVVEAGGRDKAIEAAQAMKRTDIGIPHLCVIDRDFLSEEQTKQLEERGIFVWGARMFENVLLYPPLVAEATHRPLPEVQEKIIACAARLKDQSIRTFAEQRVLQMPVRIDQSEHQGVEAHIQNQIATWQSRLEQHSSTESRIRAEIEELWDDQWHNFVDGKHLIGALNAEIGVHKTKDIFTEAILHTARQSVDLLPQELVRLRDSIRETIARPESAIPIIESGATDLDERVRAILPFAMYHPGLNDGEENPEMVCGN